MWDSLKKILKTSNEKAVIVEDGEPRYVVLSVDEYLRLSGDTPSSRPSSQQGGTHQGQGSEQQGQSLAQQGHGLTQQGQGSTPSVTPKKQDEAPAFPEQAEASNSIFTEPIHPSASDAPVDLADIDTTGDIKLADSKKDLNEINLDDLPL